MQPMQGMQPMQAALKGAREVGFTVLSISVSLVAVFTPILFMGGIVGRLFREFAVTLSTAILVSLVISLTTTPMMCARLLRPTHPSKKPSDVAAANTATQRLGYGGRIAQPQLHRRSAGRRHRGFSRARAQRGSEPGRAARCQLDRIIYASDLLACS